MEEERPSEGADGGARRPIDFGEAEGIPIGAETIARRRRRRSPAVLVWSWSPLILLVLAGFLLAGWPEAAAQAWHAWLAARAPEMSADRLLAYVRVARQVLHMLIYGLLATLALRATERTWRKTWPVWTIVGAGLLAVLDELNQLRLAQPMSAAEDVVFDLAGATIAVAVGQVRRGR